MMSGVGEEALAVLQGNLHVFGTRRLLPDVSKLARTSTRYKNIFVSERNMLGQIVRERGFEETFGKFWKADMLQNEGLFYFIMGTFPEMHESLALEFLQFAQWGWSLHAVVGVLQILRQYNHDPWIMFPKKVPAGIYSLSYISKENSDKINAWFDAMDAYHGHWVTGAIFDARISFGQNLKKDEKSNFDGNKHSFLYYMVSQFYTNEVILDELERKYDLSAALNERDAYCGKTPLIKALESFYSTEVSLQVWLLRRTDIMHPNNDQAVFTLIKNAMMFSDVDEDGDLLRILYENCSHYDWRTQNKQGLNAWQMCGAEIDRYRNQPPIFLQQLKQWLESLGAG